MRPRHRIPMLLTAAALVLSACGDDDSSNEAGGEVITGPGVTADTITLGVLSDSSGPFKSFGVNFSAGQELWLSDVNAAGGVCGRQIRLERRDHGYKAEQAKVGFAEVEPQVAGFLEVLGSPMVAALKGDVDQRQVTTVATAFSSFVLDQPYLLVAGTTYDVEVVNGLAHLMEQGSLAPGDTIGHIYIDGEYGGNALLGSKFMAARHNFTLVEKKVTSTDTDMANIVTGLKGDGIKAMVLSTSPPQTASAAAANTALGLNAAMIGNSPVFDPALLATPAADALDKLLISSSPVPFASTVPKAQEIAAKFTERFPGQSPTFSVTYGYALGVMWEQILAKACAAGDLSRAGIFAAKNSSTTLDISGLVPDLDFSSPGSPSTREVYIAKVDKAAPGGLSEARSRFVSADAQAYRAPFEK
ncbi:MAG: ABC transporter substrate-binding protein [Sporichthyaceae bacterium]